MIEVRQTEEFSRWLRRLKDANAVARIVARPYGDADRLWGLATVSTTCAVVRRS